MDKKKLITNSLIIITTLIDKIPPTLPFQREELPLFGKEGGGEIFQYLCQFNFETLNNMTLYLNRYDRVSAVGDNRVAG